jgi:agmatinase
MNALRAMLRPAGGGVHVVSTGVAEREAMQRRLYRLPDHAAAEAIEAAWVSALERLPSARVVVLGVPSDVGAGFVRGANLAPAALRSTLLDRPTAAYGRDPSIVDLGDVRVVPQLLSEDMVSEGQRAATRRALYGDDQVPWPVAPLDIARAALDACALLAPKAVPIVLGGDHSVAWPAFAAAYARCPTLGLLHFDAHTDLLEHRLGVRYCFATWAYHANALLSGDGRVVQVGVRASAHPREHWERTLGVRQFRMDEVDALGARGIADEAIARFQARGVTAVYVSDDIDGLGAEWALSTGTPEPGGLSPAFVREVIARVRVAFPLVGADVVEVAPPLHGEHPEEPARTLGHAADVLEDLMRAE